MEGTGFDGAFVLLGDVPAGLGASSFRFMEKLKLLTHLVVCDPLFAALSKDDLGVALFLVLVVMSVLDFVVALFLVEEPFVFGFGWKRRVFRPNPPAFANGGFSVLGGSAVSR